MGFRFWRSKGTRTTVALLETDLSLTKDQPDQAHEQEA